jgi:polycomb group RING finger protein 3
MENKALNKMCELIQEELDTQKIINILTCTICKGIFRDPHTINECMHTFCKACIYKHIYKSKDRYVCPYPKCKSEIYSGKPLDSIISDTSVADIVDKLFPEFKERDEADKVKCY